MTIFDLLPLYTEKKIHIDTVAFLLGTSRRTAQQMIWKARKGLYKKPPVVIKDNYDKFVDIITSIENQESEVEK